MDTGLLARLERIRLLRQFGFAESPDAHGPAPTLTAYELAEGGGVSIEHTDKASLLRQDSISTYTNKRAASGSSMSAIEKKSAPEAHVNELISDENLERRFVWDRGCESSHNLGSEPKLSTLPKTTSKLPHTNLQRSQLAPHDENYFVPIVALSKFPYKFCDKASSQAIASAFFDQGKFWAREWDLYYLWDIEESKPLILVREDQFEALLTEVNLQLDLGLKITDSQRKEGLLIYVLEHPRCRPRYLGRSHSKAEYDSMVADAPGVVVHPMEESDAPPLDDHLLEKFDVMIQDAWQATKNKSKASKEKKRVDRMQKLKVMTDQFKRAQRYLGLRPTDTEGQPEARAPQALDVSLPVPFRFDRSVVFICVDIEAYEKDHGKITEIGIATLDTRDLEGVAPGQNGKNWRSLIQARHFRIRDYAHLVNSEFVSGCPGSFFFGQSELVSLMDAPVFVESCFQPPFCAQPGTSPNVGEIGPIEKRDLIFLGHDAITDIKFLQNLGFDPVHLPNLLEAQDTATLYRVWKREEQTTKLSRILARFDIDAFGMHNAGNDAVYTVQSFLAVLVSEATIRNTPEYQQAWKDQKESRILFEQEEVKKDIEYETDGWNALRSDGDGDGGEPVPIVIKKPKVSATFLQTEMNAAPTSNIVGGHGRGRGQGYHGHESQASSRGRGNSPNRGGAAHRPPVSRNSNHTEGSATAGDSAPKSQVIDDDGWGGTATW